MKSYNKNGSGLRSFEKMILEVKELIQSEVALDKCPFPNDIPKNVPGYAELIDYVYDRSKKLFESNPAMLVLIDLRGQTEILYIRVKMNTRVCPITLLTLHFSNCRKVAPKYCAESLKWSNEAFQSIFGA